MSLVNKMLRDLDARRIGAGERAALPPAVTPLAAHGEPAAGAFRYIVLGVLAVAGAAAGWIALAPGNVDAPPAPVAAAGKPPGVPAVQDSPTGAQQAVATAPAAAEGATAVIDDSPARRVDVAPLAAGLRLASELTAPPSAPPVAPKPSPARPRSEQKSAPSQVAVAPQPAQAVPVQPPPAPPVEVRISKQERVESAAERAETEYQRGAAILRQGNADGAASRFRAALDLLPEHGAARQSLAAVLIDARHYDEAEEVLRKGTELAPVRLSSVLALARLKVERKQTPAALDLLLKHASAGERSAEFQGFAGALLNRAGRTGEAVERYQSATRLAPGESRWWAGLGIALEGAGRKADAREAYLKARALPGLPIDLAQHVEQRLR